MTPGPTGVGCDHASLAGTHLSCPRAAALDSCPQRCSLIGSTGSMVLSAPGAGDNNSEPRRCHLPPGPRTPPPARAGAGPALNGWTRATAPQHRLSVDNGPRRRRAGWVTRCHALGRCPVLARPPWRPCGSGTLRSRRLARTTAEAATRRNTPALAIRRNATIRQVLVGGNSGGASCMAARLRAGQRDGPGGCSVALSWDARSTASLSRRSE
jgi:hypothetical protein